MPYMPQFAGSKLIRALALGLMVCTPVLAQTTVSLNIDYAEGKYGEEEKSTSWTMPLIIKQQIGDFGIKLYLPYIQATGTTVSGGDRFVLAKQTQEGFGDAVVTLSYDIVNSAASGLIVGIATKGKFATADKSNDLLTTGKNDYSLQADALYPFGDNSAFVIIGRTNKGDPEGIDYRNPWYSTVGLSHQLTEAISLGGIYDYRQKVTATGDPVSEATVFLERKFADQYKLQAYVVRGFSDASPDLGAGVTLSKRF
jgi:hypothetical protein